MSCKIREIKNLKQLLGSALEPDEDIENVETSRLTALGDNYGSLILRVKVQLKNVKGEKKKVLEMVAKMLPFGEMMQTMFNVQKTFKNEIGFYTIIVPTLDDFLSKIDENLKIDFVPQALGARISLDPTCDRVDDDAVLLLENLKPAGFTVVSRLEGFDLDTSKAIVEKLAEFHAFSIALKLQNPEVFAQKVKPYLTDFHFNSGLSAALASKVEEVLGEGGFDLGVIKKAGDKIRESANKDSDEPWSCICHNDCWVNNILIKPDSKPVQIKFVDFQVIEYKSGLRDLIFFLYSSLEKQILIEHHDYLIDMYYKTFLKLLTKLKIDTTPFSVGNFNNQLKKDAGEAEYHHSIIMTHPILTEDPVDLSDVTSEDIKKLPPRSLGVKQKEKILLITSEFNRRGWLSST